MKFIRSFVIAIMTYSVIPMPQVKWEEDNTRYAIAFFPFVGMIIGAILYGWHVLCGILGLSDMVWAAGALAIPILITGGIHIDGYMDTIDALASHSSKERMLEIIKDSRVGAFAVIYEVVYMIVAFVLLYECAGSNVELLCVSYVLSRCVSGMLASILPNARNSGMLSQMMGKQEKKTKITIIVWLGILMVICIGLMIWLGSVAGVAFMVIGAGLAIVYYSFNVVRKLGGVTGDTSGYFLQLCELYMLAGLYISGFIK